VAPASNEFEVRGASPLPARRFREWGTNWGVMLVEAFVARIGLGRQHVHANSPQVRLHDASLSSAFAGFTPASASGRQGQPERIGTPFLPRRRMRPRSDVASALERLIAIYGAQSRAQHERRDADRPSATSQFLPLLEWSHVHLAREVGTRRCVDGTRPDDTLQKTHKGQSWRRLASK